MDSDFVYITFKKQNERRLGHAISFAEPDAKFLSEAFEHENPSSEETRKEPSDTSHKSSFGRVVRSFDRAISMYRDSVVPTLRLSPELAILTAANTLGRYAERRGEKIECVLPERFEVFRLPIHSMPGIMRKNEEVVAALNGALQLPQIAVIGLVSSYDAFLSDLLKVIFSKHDELVLTSDREIKFSDLAKYDSIEDAKASIIADEVENVLRKSHHEQFAWMEKKFKMTLRTKLDIWPSFVELCERRNLLTHTGGVVSAQYLKNCAEHKFQTSAKLGESLQVDLKYMNDSIELIAEIGVKLAHTLWRKFEKQELSDADFYLNDFGMNLIKIKKYKTAANILDFAVSQTNHHSDKIKRMMVVNLANAKKLSGNSEEAKKILTQYDWTASSPQFQICVAAVQDDVAEVCRLLRLGKDSIEVTASDFRDWPVFRGIRAQEDIAAAFETVFGEPLFLAKKRAKTPPDGDQDDANKQDEDHQVDWFNAPTGKFDA